MVFLVKRKLVSNSYDNCFKLMRIFYARDKSPLVFFRFENDKWGNK